MARIITGLSTALLLACCGVWLLLSAPRAGWEALVIPTGSMRPTMPVGSLALIHHVPSTSLHVGDVVTYVDPLNVRKTITHRIIKTYMIAGKVPGVMTKGDANPNPDLPVPDGSVQGEVMWHIPYAGDVLSWARSWTGIIVLVYFPALLVMIEEVKRLRDYYRLSLPYRLVGYQNNGGHRLRLSRLASAPLAGVTILGMLIWQPLVAAASFGSTTMLTENRITAAATPSLSCQSNTNVSASNSTSQTAVSGEVSSSGSTNSSNAISGGAINNSSTNINISIRGSC